jgi:hypothetical protein
MQVPVSALRRHISGYGLRILLLTAYMDKDKILYPCFFADLMQARSMAAKNARTARVGNIISGFLLMGFSMPFGLLGGEAVVGRESSAAVVLQRHVCIINCKANVCLNAFV